MNFTRSKRYKIRSRYDIIFCITRNFYLVNNYDGYADYYTDRNIHVQFKDNKIVFFSIDLYDGVYKLTRYLNKPITEVVNYDLQP